MAVIPTMEGRRGWGAGQGDNKGEADDDWGAHDRRLVAGSRNDGSNSDDSGDSSCGGSKCGSSGDSSSDSGGQCQCDVSNNAIALRATAPSQLGR